jgi:hypothetical protein
MAFEDAPSILHEASFVGTHARSISSFIPTLRDFLHALQPKLAGVESFFSHYHSFLPLFSFLETNQTLRRGEPHHAKHDPNCSPTNTSVKPAFQQDLENQDFSPMFT